MAAPSRSEVIEGNPIGTGLDAFRESFSSVCKGAKISCASDAIEQLGQEDLQNLALILLSALQILPVARQLYSNSGRALFNELSRLSLAVTSEDPDLDRIKPLLKAATADDRDDALVWGCVYDAVAESTPPPRTIASSLQQTPWSQNTSSVANSSEYRRDMDGVLKQELVNLYVGVRRFRETYFGGVPGLEAASESVFKKCTGGENPLFGSGGWSGWPKDAKEKDVLGWFAGVIDQLAELAKDHIATAARRRPLAQPNKTIPGATSAERKLDVGFVSDPEAGKDTKCKWSRILVPGELKSNAAADMASKTWLDLGKYAREVLAAQDTRRFVLGFTLCGSLMRLWEFDRLGGLASEQFNINKDGRQFVSTILGFLWMSETDLGFDPTIVTKDGQRFVEILRDGSTERLVIDEVMRRAPCVAGRATTCWRAHRAEAPLQRLVIKDSWQYPERDEEGELLREATEKGVTNVARYYHHETVSVHGEVDDIRGNVRGGLDITTATNYRPGRSPIPLGTSTQSSRKGRSRSTAGAKRPSSQTDVALPPSKRGCSASPTKASNEAFPNRVHRRLILRDYGKPIYTASSREALLAGLEGCIRGHQSLHEAGLLHRDISINNLIINEEVDDPRWRSFLIDLDLGIRVSRTEASGAHGKTGTRAFMAIGALLGEQHSFMHDLESFFWVLFWICIHYSAQGKDIGTTELDSWNYENDDGLAEKKMGVIADEDHFLNKAKRLFTPYYQPLIPCVNKLRKTVFPQGGRWKRSDPKLYSSMREILREAQKDRKVLTEA